MPAAILPVISGIGALFQVGSGIAAIAGAGEQKKLSEQEAAAERAQATYQAGMLKLNAGLIDDQAADVTARGGLEANRMLAKGDQVVGAQRAAFAASGIDINSGSAAMVQQEARSMAAVDALTIRNNAWREAYGYKVQAIDLRSQAAMALATGKARSDITLATGGMKAAGQVAQGVGSIGGGIIGLGSAYGSYAGGRSQGSGFTPPPTAPARGVLGN